MLQKRVRGARRIVGQTSDNSFPKFPSSVSVCVFGDRDRLDVVLVALEPRRVVCVPPPGPFFEPRHKGRSVFCEEIRRWEKDWKNTTSHHYANFKSWMLIEAVELDYGRCATSVWLAEALDSPQVQGPPSAARKARAPEWRTRSPPASAAGKSGGDRAQATAPEKRGRNVCKWGSLECVFCRSVSGWRGHVCEWVSCQIGRILTGMDRCVCVKGNMWRLGVWV